MYVYCSIKHQGHPSISHQILTPQFQSPVAQNPLLVTRYVHPVPFTGTPYAMEQHREKGVPERHMFVSYQHPIASCPKQLALARSVYRRPSSFPPGITPTQHTPSACKLLLWSIYRAQGQPRRERGTSFGILSACENFPGA